MKRPAFILGAPTPELIEKLCTFNPDAIFINASFETFNEPVTNVHDVPTNFRAHSDDKKTLQAGVHIVNVGSFKLAQEKVAATIVELLNYDAKIYFASIPRKDRPFRIYVEDGETKVEDNEELKGDKEFSENFFNTHVLPHFSGLNKVLTEALIRHNPDHKASYIADALSVACACLLNVKNWETHWETHKISAVVAKNGEYENKKTMNKDNVFYDGVKATCVHYAKCVEGEKTIYSFKSENVKALAEAMISKPQKTWDYAFVWHDTNLNDVDDPVAIQMIQERTNNDIETHCNYMDAPVAIQMTKERTKHLIETHCNYMIQYKL
jgi:hypothetical protein